MISAISHKHKQFNKKNRLVKLLSPEAIDQSVHTLVNSFFYDPLVTYLLPEEKKRKKVLPLFMKAAVLFGLLYGTVYVGPDEEGVAICFPPHISSMNIKALYRSGVFSLPFAIGLIDFVRLFRLLMTLDGYQHTLLPTPHWYLAILGVDPKYQKKGVGSLLVDSLLQQAKKEHIPVYLETMNEKNLSFYQKRGFRLVKKAYSSDKKLPFWIMIATR